MTPDTIIAIDAGEHAALWWTHDGGKTVGHRALKDVSLPALLAELAALRSDKYVVVIEKMTGTWGKSYGHKQAANLVGRMVKEALKGCRLRVIWVDPGDWQLAVTKGYPDPDPKKRSLAMVNYWLREELHMDDVITDHNEADAGNLLRYYLDHQILFEIERKQKGTK